MAKKNTATALQQSIGIFLSNDEGILGSLATELQAAITTEFQDDSFVICSQSHNYNAVYLKARNLLAQRPSLAIVFGRSHIFPFLEALDASKLSTPVIYVTLEDKLGSIEHPNDGKLTIVQLPSVQSGRWHAEAVRNRSSSEQEAILMLSSADSNEGVAAETTQYLEKNFIAVASAYFLFDSYTELKPLVLEALEDLPEHAVVTFAPDLALLSVAHLIAGFIKQRRATLVIPWRPSASIIRSHCELICQQIAELRPQCKNASAGEEIFIS